MLKKTDTSSPVVLDFIVSYINAAQQDHTGTIDIQRAHFNAFWTILYEFSKPVWKQKAWMNISNINKSYSVNHDNDIRIVLDIAVQCCFIVMHIYSNKIDTMVNCFALTS